MLSVDLEERSTASPADPGSASIAPVSLSTTVLAAVRYHAAGDAGRSRFAAALAHLADLYGPLVDDGPVSGAWDPASSIGLVVVGGRIGPGGVCWGRPIGAHGIASSDELHRAVADASRARELLGFWAAAAWTAGGLRLSPRPSPCTR